MLYMGGLLSRSSRKYEPGGEKETYPSPRGDSGEQGKRRAITMEKWECTVCGYVYDPAEEDGVAFEELPDDWTCPICGVGKEDFVLLED